MVVAAVVVVEVEFACFYFFVGHREKVFEEVVTVGLGFGLSNKVGFASKVRS